MKKKSVFLIGMAALAFAACSNEDNNPIQGTDGGNKPDETQVVEGQPTYVSFSVAGAKSRAVAESPNDNGDLQKIFVLIFNDGTKVLEQKVLFDENKISQTFLVTSGKKRILALANLPSAMFGQIEGLQEKSAVLNDVLNLKMEDGITTIQGEEIDSKAYLPMSTVNTDEIFTLKEGVSLEDAQKTDPDNSNKISLSIRRMIAKVKLNAFTHDRLTFKGFVIGNIARPTYYIQHAVGGIVKSPLYNEMYDANNFTHDDKYTAFNDNADTNPENGNEANKYYYLTENTALSFVQGTASHILIKGKYVPEKLIDGATFDVGTQQLKYTYASTANYGDSLLYITGNDEETNKIINDGLFIANKVVLQNLIKTYNDGKASTAPALTEVKFADYTKGSFYRVNIGESVGTDTKYGIERNRQYNISVNNVTGPGYTSAYGAVMGSGSDDTPIDQKTYIDVTISVEDWKDADQNADLN